MKLSIIIPMYNVENYIDQCLNSILDQNILKEDYEILLIDDGSKDNSISLAEKYTNEYYNIHLYLQKNQGVSIARNNGLKYAKGKYIYFVDADDYIALDTLNHILNCANKNNLDIIEFKNIRTKSRKYKNSNTKDIPTHNVKSFDGKNYISSRAFHDALWVYFYKRDFLLNTKLKFYEGRTKQDMIFNAELIPKAKSIAYYPLDVYRYVINPNSITTRKDSEGLRRSIEDFIFITIKYNELILKLEAQKVNTKILRSKQQTQLFNIFKGLLISDFKFTEIILIIKNLSKHKLYPLHLYYGKNNFRKYLVIFFNNKNLFFFFIWFYRIFYRQINKLIVKKYQNKKENQIISSF